MKVIALLCFYDEQPAMLAATVASLAKIADHVVASDGGYFLFPGARAHSGIESHEVITQTAYAAGIGCTIHAPTDVWYGNEVSKRNHLVQLGMTIAEPGVDWFLRIDADELVTDVPFDFRERLAATDCDAAGVTLWWRSSLNGTGADDQTVRDFDVEGQDQMRFLLRALPGLCVEGAHNFYLAEKDGETVVLYGRRDMHDEVELADFHDVRLEHRHNHRIRARNARAEEFNQRRDQLGIERVWNMSMESVDGDMVPLPWVPNGAGGVT